MYRAICNAISTHGFTYACSKYVTFSTQHLLIMPATCGSQSQGSCQVIAQACFTATHTPNSFRRSHPNPAAPNGFFFMIIPLFRGDDQNFIPAPKAIGISCFIPGKHSSSLFDATHDTASVQALNIYGTIQTHAYCKSLQCCWVAAISKQCLHTGK